MLLSKPLHQTPVTYFGTQIPPPMKSIFQKFLASYLFAYLMLGVQVLIVMLLFVEYLTLIQFTLCAIGLWIACSLVVAYLKDMQFIHIFKIFVNTLHIYTNPFHLFLTTTQCSETNSFTGLELGLVSIPNKEFRKGSTLAEYGQS